MTTNIYELDGTSLKERESAHVYLQETLGFPDWYGKNLDALHDLLTAFSAPTMIFISASDSVDAAIAKVFEDAMEENAQLTVVFEE